MSTAISQAATATDKPPRRRCRIPLSLKLFASMLAVAGAAATIWLVSLQLHYRWQMEAITVVERLGGTVRCRRHAPDWLVQLLPDGSPPSTRGLGPNWIRQCLPAQRLIDYTLVVEEVWLDNGPGMRVNSNLSGERNDVGTEDPTDEDLRFVARFVNLKRLYLRDTRISDAGLKNLRPLQNLEVLLLSRTQITDESMEVVAGFQKLETLRLFQTRLTDAGLAQLRQLKHLTELDVGDTQVTEEGLKPFRNRAGFRLEYDFDDQDPLHIRMIW